MERFHPLSSPLIPAGKQKICVASEKLSFLLKSRIGRSGEGMGVFRVGRGGHSRSELGWSQRRGYKFQDWENLRTRPLEGRALQAGAPGLGAWQSGAQGLDKRRTKSGREVKKTPMGASESVRLLALSLA